MIWSVPFVTFLILLQAKSATKRTK
jgi:hypothetical protein